MNALFVMRRPGIIVVSGIVMEASEREIVIENDFPFPVTGTSKARCRLEVPEGTADRMKLSRGAAIIASATDDFAIEMLFDGGEPATKEFSLKAYTVRYNGSFDFDRYGQEKECHVFSGNVLNATTSAKNGVNVSRMRIGWKRKGHEEIRNCLLWNMEGSAEEYLNKRVILVTGEERHSGTLPFYVASKILTV